jgi:hypothetical protein
VCVCILRPDEPKARLPRGIGRPAACLFYLYYVQINPTRAGVDALLHVALSARRFVEGHAVFVGGSIRPGVHVECVSFGPFPFKPCVRRKRLAAECIVASPAGARSVKRLLMKQAA